MTRHSLSLSNHGAHEARVRDLARRREETRDMSTGEYKVFFVALLIALAAMAAGAALGAAYVAGERLQELRIEVQR